MIAFSNKEMKKNELGTSIFFTYDISSFSPKIQCNNSLEPKSEQQKNMCFKQNVTMTLYKK